MESKQEQGSLTLVADLKKTGVHYSILADGVVIGTRKSRRHSATYRYTAVVVREPRDGSQKVVVSYHMTSDAASKKIRAMHAVSRRFNVDGSARDPYRIVALEAN